jgi:methionyl-tRNA formyltransferase
MSNKSIHPCPYRVTFLIDKTNNWIEHHLKQSQKFISDSKFTFQTSHDPAEITDQDIVFILGFTKILGSEFLKKNKLNLVIHESDLPLGQGFAPVQWQILEGKNKISICLIEASEPVDSGDILFKSSFAPVATSGWNV